MDVWFVIDKAHKLMTEQEMWQTGLSSWHPQTRQPANHSPRTALSNQNLSFCPDFPFWNIQGPRRHSSLPLPEGWKSIAALPSAQTSPSKLRSTLHSIFNEALWILLIFLSSNGAASSFTDCLGAGLTAGQQQTFNLSSDQQQSWVDFFCCFCFLMQKLLPSLRSWSETSKLFPLWW